MNNNNNKYEHTITQIENLIQDVTTSLSENKKATNNYCIIPRPNSEKKYLRLYIKNLSNNTSFTIYQSATTQGIKIYDKNHSELCSYVQAINNGKKTSILSYADKTNISENSSFNSDTNCFDTNVNIKESYLIENGKVINNECFSQHATPQSKYILKTNHMEMAKTLEDKINFQNHMLYCYYLLNSNSILNNIKSLRKQLAEYIKSLDEPNNPDTSDIENR